MIYPRLKVDEEALKKWITKQAEEVLKNRLSNLEQVNVDVTSEEGQVKILASASIPEKLKENKVPPIVVQGRRFIVPKGSGLVVSPDGRKVSVTKEKFEDLGVTLKTKLMDLLRGRS